MSTTSPVQDRSLRMKRQAHLNVSSSGDVRTAIIAVLGDAEAQEAQLVGGQFPIRDLQGAASLKSAPSYQAGPHKSMEPLQSKRVVTLRRIIKRPGVRLRRWNSPAHFRRTSASSSANSSQEVLPSLMRAASWVTSSQTSEPHRSFLIFSNLLAFLASAATLVGSGSQRSPLTCMSMPAWAMSAAVSSPTAGMRGSWADCALALTSTEPECRASLGVVVGHASQAGCRPRPGRWDGIIIIAKHICPGKQTQFGLGPGPMTRSGASEAQKRGRAMYAMRCPPSLRNYLGILLTAK